MKSLQFQLLAILILLAGCGEKVEIDLDKAVEIPELSWDLPDGWKAEKTDLDRNMILTADYESLSNSVGTLLRFPRLLCRRKTFICAVISYIER